jgi:hypothetical protein
MQTVWDYKSSRFDHFALTAWNIPDNKYVDTVVALAQKGILFLWDLGYFNPSMWPQLSSPLEHFFLFLSLLLLSWCALDLAAHILVASASEVASHFTRPVTISAPVYRALASL